MLTPNMCFSWVLVCFFWLKHVFWLCFSILPQWWHLANEARCMGLLIFGRFCSEKPIQLLNCFRKRSVENSTCFFRGKFLWKYIDTEKGIQYFPKGTRRYLKTNNVSENEVPPRDQFKIWNFTSGSRDISFSAPTHCWIRDFHLMKQGAEWFDVKKIAYDNPAPMAWSKHIRPRWWVVVLSLPIFWTKLSQPSNPF